MIYGTPLPVRAVDASGMEKHAIQDQKAAGRRGDLLREFHKDIIGRKGFLMVRPAGNPRGSVLRSKGFDAVQRIDR